MSLNRACTHINFNGGLYLVLAILAQAEKDKHDGRLSVDDRRDADLFLCSGGTMGVYDLCVEYKKIYAVVTEKPIQSLDKFCFL